MVEITAKLSYKEEIVKAMQLLAEDDRTIFIGQGAEYTGSPMYEAVKNLPLEKRIEMPVAEDMQMGMSIGLSLMGFIPVSMYPRMDFLVLAMNQLVNHLDKIEEMSVGRFKPKVIIRTAVGARRPLYPGAQHCQDHSDALRDFLTNVDIIRLEEAEQIVAAYKKALESNRSTILVEYSEKMRENV